jgi:hypothetical protein
MDSRIDKGCLLAALFATCRRVFANQPLSLIQSAIEVELDEFRKPAAAQNASRGSMAKKPRVGSRLTDQNRPLAALLRRYKRRLVTIRRS